MADSTRKLGGTTVIGDARPSQMPYPAVESGQEWNRLIKLEEAKITASLLGLLPSTFVAEVPSPNYAIHLKRVARELARIRVELSRVVDDRFFNATRSEYVYQMIAYFVYVHGNSPEGLSDTDFKTFLLDVIAIFFQGSTPKSMQDAAALLFSDVGTPLVREMSAEASIPGSGWGVSDTHKWLIDLHVDTLPADLFTLIDQLNVLIRIVKPAHTLYSIRFVFSETFTPVVDGVSQFDLKAHWYEDFRKYCDGVRGVDRLGVKEPIVETLESHTADFGDWVATSDLVLRTHKGPLAKPGVFTLADTTSDVAVYVNGVAIPTALIKSISPMLGEITVDQSVWLPGSTIAVSYSWLIDPVIEMVSFDPLDPLTWGYGSNQSHSWGSGRFQSSVVTALGVTPQPLEVGWRYKMYERAYSALSNDPTLLVSNAPFHKPGWPPFEHAYSTENVLYPALALPDSTTECPWDLMGGAGCTAVVAGGSLTIEDTASTEFPDADFLYYYRHLDLTVPHLFNFAVRLQVESATQLNGAFTGVGFMFADDLKAGLVGALEVGGARHVGILKKGGAEQIAASWETVAVDWSVEHTYRLQQLQDGNVYLYIDGSAVPDVTVSYADLPLLSELNVETPDRVMGVYFGTFSRETRNKSRWEFVRYLFIPTFDSKVESQILSYYECDVLPQDDGSDPWLVIGSGGSERIYPVGTLLVSDTTSTGSAAVEGAVEFVGSRRRTYFHDEPALEKSAWLAAEWKGRVQHATESATGVGFVADDGWMQVKVTYLKSEAFRKFGYPGQTLPEEDPEADTVIGPEWQLTAAGAPLIEMVGRRLHLSTTAAQSYSYGATWSSTGSVPGLYCAGPFITAGNDWQLESRVTVSSFTGALGTGPFGLSVNEAEDPAGRNLRRHAVSGLPEAALCTLDTSTGTVSTLAQAYFDWDDGQPHTYRVQRNTTDALPANWIVLLFIDDQLAVSTAYSGFMPSDNSGGAYNHVNFYSTDLGASDCYLDFVSFYNYDSDASSSMFVGLEVKGTLPTPFYEFSAPTSFSAAAVDWTVSHTYSLTRDPTGFVVLSIDGVVAVSVECNNICMPASPGYLDDSLPTNFVAFGSFSSTGMSRSLWDYFRYRIYDGSQKPDHPQHMVSNQCNVLASPDHLFTDIPHSHCDQPLSSQGVPTDQFLATSGMLSFTTLNEGSVPLQMTQEAVVTEVAPDVYTVTGQGGWDHWGPTGSGLYTGADFFELETGDVGLISPICDIQGLHDIGIQFESGCLTFDMGTDPVLYGFDFEETGGGVYSFSPTQVDVSSADGFCYFSHTGPNATLPLANLLRTESQDCSIEVRFLVSTYAVLSNRNVGFTFCDGERTITFAVGGTILGGVFRETAEVFGVAGRRIVEWASWSDGGWHTVRLIKRVAGQCVEVYLDGVRAWNLTLPFAVAGRTAQQGVWADAYLQWGSSLPYVDAPSKVPAGGAVAVSFDSITVCETAEEAYVIPAEPSGKVLVLGGGAPVSWTYTGGGGHSTDIMVGVFNDASYFGVGGSHAVRLDLDLFYEDVYAGMAEVPLGPTGGSFAALSQPLDPAYIGCYNNYPGYPDPAEPGSLLGPGAGVSDCTFWLGPLVLPQFPAISVLPCPAGPSVVIPL
jgi:hypothetical protein